MFVLYHQENVWYMDNVEGYDPLLFQMHAHCMNDMMTMSRRHERREWLLEVWCSMNVVGKSSVVVAAFYPTMFHPVIERPSNDLLALSLISVEQCQLDVMMMVVS